MRILSLILISLIICSCKKEKLIPSFSLPEITSSGKNTMGFIVEKKVWVPHWEKYSWGEGCQELKAGYMRWKNRFELSGGIKIDGKKCYFDLYIDSLFEIGTVIANRTMYIMDDNGIFIQNGGYYGNVCAPNTSVDVIINRLDTINKIVSGIFGARLKKTLVMGGNMQDLYPNSPDYIEIKDGRFDVHYNYCR